MKRGSVLLGAFATGAAIVAGVPAVAQEFVLNGAFTPDPNAHQNVAYVTALSIKPKTGAPPTIAADLAVFKPGTSEHTNVIAVVEKIAAGSAFDAYFSQENTQLIRSLQQSAAGAAFSVSATCAGYTYNQQTKTWQTQVVTFDFSPKAAVDVDIAPATILKSGIDVHVYKIEFRRG